MEIKEMYVAPEVEVVLAEVEAGFNASAQNNGESAPGDL